jgi:CubicO group peptidase (beta-lactamase class C family)
MICNRRVRPAVLSALATMVLSMFASADAPPPTAAELGLMVGSPPPADKRVTRENFIAGPAARWSYQHMREIFPTRVVPRSAGAAPLSVRQIDLDNLPVQLDAKRSATVAQWLTDAYTDGFIVLHDGAVVYERYLNGQTPSSPHLMFSVTKSFTGTLALMLMEEGKLDGSRTIASYVPELAGTAFADATVQHLLNMTNSIEFDETYDDPKSDISRFAAAFSSCDGSAYSYLQTLKKPNARFTHGQAFHYVTPDPEVLGWVIRRVTGKTLAQVLEEKIWSKLGTDQDGYYWVDSEGTEMAGGGFNIALRDGARFGQMILDDGKFNGQQIVSAAIAKRIKQPGDHDVFARFYKDDPWYQSVGFAYHDQWWTFNNSHKAVSALGIHGQYIYIDPVARMVIVKQTSDPDADSLRNDVDGPIVMHTIALHLMKTDAAAKP